MLRILIIASVVVGVLALLIGGAMFLFTPRGPVVVESTQAVKPEATVKTAPEKIRKLRNPPAAETKDAAVAAAPAAEARKAEIAAAEMPEGEVDPEAILKSLTPEQEQKLQQMLSMRQIEKMRQEQRYQLMGDLKLQRLTSRNNGELKLSEVQQQQVNAIKDGFKARLDAQLAADWTRSDELYRAMFARQQIEQSATATDAEKAAAQQELIPIYKELEELNLRAERARQGLNDDYMAALGAVLTTQQSKTMDEMGSIHVGGSRFGFTALENSSSMGVDH